MALAVQHYINLDSIERRSVNQFDFIFKTKLVYHVFLTISGKARGSKDSFRSKFPTPFSRGKTPISNEKPPIIAGVGSSANDNRNVGVLVDLGRGVGAGVADAGTCVGTDENAAVGTGFDGLPAYQGLSANST